MEEKHNLTLKHSKILYVLLSTILIATLFMFYNNLFTEYELFIQALQNSALILLSFIFVFIILNLHLIAGDIKVKKVFDHLIFFAFLFYIFVYNISLLDRISSGELFTFAEGTGMLSADLIINHVLVAAIIPLIIMFTLLWSIRNVKLIARGENKNRNKSEAKHDSVGLVYYLFVILSFAGLAYSQLTPLYSLY